MSYYPSLDTLLVAVVLAGQEDDSPLETLIWQNPDIVSAVAHAMTLDSRLAITTALESQTRHKISIELNNERIGPMPLSPIMYLDNDDVLKVGSIVILNENTYTPEVGTGLTDIEIFFSESPGLDAEPIGDWVLEPVENGQTGEYIVLIEGEDKTTYLSDYIGQTVYVIVRHNQDFRVVGQVTIEEVRAA